MGEEEAEDEVRLVNFHRNPNTCVSPSAHVAVKDDKEIELRRGLHLDAGQEIVVHRHVREKQFKLGKAIQFSVDEFQELAFAIDFFADDLRNHGDRNYGNYGDVVDGAR